MAYSMASASTGGDDSEISEEEWIGISKRLGCRRSETFENVSVSDLRAQWLAIGYPPRKLRELFLEGLPLHQAAKHDEVDVVGRILATNTVDVNAINESGETALHLCALEGHVNVVQLLIKAPNDAEILVAPVLNRNAKDTAGNTALHLAVQKGHVNVVEMLLTPVLFHPDEAEKRRKGFAAAGANVNIQNNEFNTALILATGNGHEAIVAKLLETRRMDVNIQNNEFNTALILATGNGHEAIVAKLLEKSSLDVNIRNNEFHTALILASGNGHEAIVAKLLESPRMDVNFGTKFRKTTALHIATQNCHVKIVDMLLKVQDVNAIPQDELGETPLHIAARLGHDILVRKLIANSGFNLLEDKMRRNPCQCALDFRRDVVVRMIKDHIGTLYRDRQMHVGAANAILVGAALIASVTFASWLQPPLGYTTYYGEEYSNPFPGPPTSNPQYATFEHHLMIEFFWVFNSFSFFSAIASVIIGARSVLPSHKLFINQEVDKIRRGLFFASCLLTVSMAFVLAAFAMAGIVLLPPLPALWANILSTVAVGGGLCLYFLVLLSKKIFTLKTPLVRVGYKRVAKDVSRS